MESPDNIRITFSDGEAMDFPPINGESILGSAEKAGNTLASNCREGTCRTCMARDADGNEVLLCITPAQPGMALNLPYQRPDVMPPSLRRAKINAFSRASRSVWEIRYRLQFPLPFLPGQYVEVLFPGMASPRRFSMANPPSGKEQVLHVRDLPGGAMSTYLNERAKPEDAFTVRGPFGVFYLRSTARPKLFVAGGTGLAPIVSMLSSIDPATTPPLAVIAGFADAEDAYALEALRTLAKTLPLELILAADKASEAWRGFVGNPIAALGEIRTIPLDNRTEAYLCGPPGMVNAARSALLARNLQAAAIFNEEFVHSS
ncbi:2Fe-2S iron-sulfur cluster binding domain-containing protein [Mesorhizobium retamae]|uniref:2Fe-2S iron-sulfur cluster binding domain-containing protein n=1 Tax=Mesorhizobium retamae TaxID=2912854 RepID=A0ABS9QKU4_9HYPH|nr:2Fe-2S iron-sulfur cluster binding domain-containing protein [Mesorhizobium sp. IRAMC:0171]MCG7508060.1 2Fe-2S iron-sulfur cluster binding domain-containing protein [Mesorhizobium sp. IRAMC:0171]